MATVLPPSPGMASSSLVSVYTPFTTASHADDTSFLLFCDMTPAEEAVLRVLVQHPGKVVSRSTLQRLSGMQHCAPRRCDGIMSSLRRMLGEDAIVTVRGRGWMLTSDCATRAAVILLHCAA